MTSDSCSDGSPIDAPGSRLVTIEVRTEKVILADREKVDGLSLDDGAPCASYSALVSFQDKSMAYLSTKACARAHSQESGMDVSPWLLGGTMRLSDDKLLASFVRALHVVDATDTTVRDCHYEDTGTLARQ